MSDNSSSASHWCKAVVEAVVPKANLLVPIVAPPVPPSMRYPGKSPTAASSTTHPHAATAGFNNGATGLNGGVSGSMTTGASMYSSTASVSSSKGNQAINPQFLQLYQQLYGGSTQSSSTAGTNGVASASSSSSKESSAHASYASVAACTTNNDSNNSAALYSKPISAPWGNAYSYQAMQQAATQPSVPPAPVPPPSYHSVPPPPQLAAMSVKKPNPSRFSSITSDDTSTVNAAVSAQAQSRKVMGKQTPQPTSQPETLKLFVQRSFASCTTDKEREFVNSQLMTLIAKVSAEGRLHVHKWELEPTLRYIPPPDPAPVKAPIATLITAVTQPIKSSSTPTKYATNYASGIYGPAAAGVSKDSTDGRVSIQSTSNQGHQYSGTSIYGPGGGNDGGPSNKGDAAAAVNGSKKKKKRDTVKVSEGDSPPVKKSVLAGLDKLDNPRELQMREKRQNRFQADSAISGGDKDNSSTLLHAPRSNRKKGQKQQQQLLQSQDMSEFDMESLKIVGTCVKLEKDYLRLTSAPHPSVVRPESVLWKALKLIKDKWADDIVDYVYMCSQLKSIRQDLTVQHIQNDFTVHVYETHSRVALESDDMNEYNQCQTQLKQLYSAGYQGCEMEFVAYRVLYYVYLLGNKKYTGGSSDLSHLMASLSSEAYRNAAVCHALEVRKAVQLSNYHRFFQLYKETPNMGTYILDLMVDTIRVQALQKMCRAYRPEPLKLLFVLSELAFDDTVSEHIIGIEFLRKVGCIIAAAAPASNNSTGDQQQQQHPDLDLRINTKESQIDISLLQDEAKLLL